MQICKNWKKVVIWCLLVVLLGAIVWSLLPKSRKVLESQLVSPDGNLAVDVWRRSGDDAFEFKNSKGPKWSASIHSIQGVTQFCEGSFSPDSRHLILVFADADCSEQYYWIDYETSLSGGLPLEGCCKTEESFAAEIKKERIWTDISFRFLGWHPKKNLALFAYELTTATGGKHSGYFWYDIEARYRYKENPTYVMELPLD